MAILQGLEAAISKEWTNIIMEGDCLQVINILSTGANSLASFGASIDASLASSSNFSSLFFRFVKHSGNALAHELASNSCFSNSEGHSLPSEIDYLV